jgi:hypothetical protein
MKAKQYVAFLQTDTTHAVRMTPPARTRLNKVTTTVPVTDKITLMVEAANPAAAKAKLSDMVATAARVDPDLCGVTEVSLLQLVEIRKVPARGLVLRHEAVFDLLSLNCPLDTQRGARQVPIKDGDELLWTR